MSFSPEKIDNFLEKSKLNFWTKNEDFEQCVIATLDFFKAKYLDTCIFFEVLQFAYSFLILETKVKSCLEIKYWKWEEQKRVSLSKMSVAFTFCICLFGFKLLLISSSRIEKQLWIADKKVCNDVIYLFVEDFFKQDQST